MSFSMELDDVGGNTRSTIQNLEIDDACCSRNPETMEQQHKGFLFVASP